VPLTRYRRIANLWNWLPPFRAAAEYQSIQRAALALNMSPSALSRTVRLLEDAIGSPLFVRSTTGLTLTVEGDSLLAATRDAMRMIDESLHERTPSSTPRVVLAASGPYLPLLLARAISAHSTMIRETSVEIRTVTSDEAGEHLLRGTIDLAFVHDAEVNRELSSELVGAMRLSLWAPAGSSNAPHVMVRHVGIDTGAISAPSDLGNGEEIPIWVDACDAAIEMARRCVLPLRCPDAIAPAEFAKQKSSSVVETALAVTALRRKALPGQERPVLDQLIATMRELIA
jgi:DNA-binding transcriptional LysR family regulator